MLNMVNKGLILAFILIPAVFGIGFEVHVYDSSGNRISDGNPNPRKLYAGDFVYCVAAGVDPEIEKVYFAWVKIPPAPGEEAPVGPNFMQFPSEEDHSNRLYIGRTLGNGEESFYTCIATDENPYEVREQYVGAQFRFYVVDPPEAGYIFEEKDHAAMSGQVVSLLATRNNENARVLWETINIEGTQQKIIYDSANPSDLPQGYSWVNPGGDDFTLDVTITEDTATLTRCTITFNSMTDVTRTTMIFMLDFEGTGCSASNLDPQGNDAGDAISFRGCNIMTSYSQDSGLTKDHYTTMTYWQQSTVEAPQDYVPIDSSRSLDEDSRHDIYASSQTHQNIYSCAVEVHREQAGVIRAKVENFCENEYEVTVNENTVRFRMYYGDREDLLFEDFVEFNAQGNARINPTTGDLTCEIDRMPDPATDDKVLMQSMAHDSDVWIREDNHIILSADIQVGSKYSCIFVEEGVEEPIQSGIIHMVNGFVMTKVYNSNNELLNSDDVYVIESGDYLECRSDDPINPLYPPSFYWYRSNQLPNTDGPKTIRMSNTEDETNRLYISKGFGMGEPISYRCIGADFLASYIIPDFAGTLVMFEADIPDNQDPDPSEAPSGTSAEPGDSGADLNHGNIIMTCLTFIIYFLANH